MILSGALTSYQQSNAQAMVTVEQDRGPSMDAEILAQMIDSGFQGDQQRRGSQPKKLSGAN